MFFGNLPAKIVSYGCEVEHIRIVSDVRSSNLYDDFFFHFFRNLISSSFIWNSNFAYTLSGHTQQLPEEIKRPRILVRSCFAWVGSIISDLLKIDNARAQNGVLIL